MISFQQELIPNSSRPIIDDFYGATALIDTGAEIPVCTLSGSVLRDTFDAELRLANTSITGFGGKDYGDVYVLKSFKWKELEYPSLPVFVPKETHGLKVRWIISASMLDRLEYTVNMKTLRLTVNIPEDESRQRRLRVYDSKGKLHVLCDPT